MATQTTSNRFKLNKEDMTKVGKGLLIAIAGTALTYASNLLPLIDWNGYEPFVIPLASTVVNLGLKWVSNKGKLY